MEVKVTSQKENPMLKRKEISFQVEHAQTGHTPSRTEVRKAIAAITKAHESVVLVRKFETKTGTQTAIGLANIYETVEQAKLIEPKYVIKRNNPPEEIKETTDEKKG